MFLVCRCDKWQWGNRRPNSPIGTIINWLPWRCPFRQFTKAQMRNFFHTIKVLTSYHVSATLMVIENRNNEKAAMNAVSNIFPMLSVVDVVSTSASLGLIRVFSARCNIYISRLCYDVSVRLSVRLSVMEVHWHIIANLGFKFRSHFTAHYGRRAARCAACGRIISRHASQC